MPAHVGTVFFNPSSGTKAGRAELDEMKDAMNAASLEVISIKPGLDITKTISSRMERGQRLFIAAGGDGSIHHVVQPLVNSGATFAVLPLGTYNHFARDLGIPLDWREALDVALHGATRQIDTARVNDQFFVNNLVLGLYPELVARREERGRDYPRWRATLLAIYSTLRTYRHVTVMIESDTVHELVKTHVLMVSNNGYDLSQIGIEAPRNRLDEGRLSVYWLPHQPRLKLMRFVARYLAGRVRSAPGFRSVRTTRLKVQLSRPSIQVGIDGEVFRLVTPLAVTTVPQSLLVKVPAATAAETV